MPTSRTLVTPARSVCQALRTPTRSSRSAVTPIAGVSPNSRSPTRWLCPSMSPGITVQSGQVEDPGVVGESEPPAGGSTRSAGRGRRASDRRGPRRRPGRRDGRHGWRSSVVSGRARGHGRAGYRSRWRSCRRLGYDCGCNYPTWVTSGAETMDEGTQHALERSRTIDMTTIGRRSGLPRGSRSCSSTSRVGSTSPACRPAPPELARQPRGRPGLDVPSQGRGPR